MRCSGIAVTQLTPKAGSVQETQQEHGRNPEKGRIRQRGGSRDSRDYAVGKHLPGGCPCLTSHMSPWKKEPTPVPNL